MRSPHSRKPAPAVAKGGLPKSDRLGGQIGTTGTTKRTRAQTYRAKALRRWPKAIILPPEPLDSDGPWIVITKCWDADGVISLHPTRLRARKTKRDLDRNGCSRRDSRWCQGRHLHQIIDMRQRAKRRRAK